MLEALDGFAWSDERLDLLLREASRGGETFSTWNATKRRKSEKETLGCAVWLGYLMGLKLRIVCWGVLWVLPSG